MLPVPQGVTKMSKKLKQNATNLPLIESHEVVIDMSLLDVMGIEDFLLHLKNRTENNSKELWKETCRLAQQLKASRELLSIGSNLFSNQAAGKILDRLVDSAHVLLNAERIFLLELDTAGKNLVVTHAIDKSAYGIKISSSSGIEGDVVARKICANVPDVSQDERFVPALDSKLGIKTKSMICAPIIADGIVLGVVQAVNKKHPDANGAATGHGMGASPRLSPRISPRLNSSPVPVLSHLTEHSLPSTLAFTANEALLLTFIAANAGLALSRGGDMVDGSPTTSSYLTRDEKSGATGTLSTVPTRSTSSHQVILPANITGTDTYVQGPGGAGSSSNGAVSKMAESKTEAYSTFLIQGLRLMLTNQNAGVKELWEAAYSCLHAERISVFMYNPSSASLVCTISQDIEGVSIAVDKGIAGHCFTTRKLANSSDASTDGRHNKDVDRKTGFVTRNILCTPIIMGGKAVGVLQALNKTTTDGGFTYEDERQIQDISQKMVAFLKEQEGTEEEEEGESGAGGKKTPSRSTLRGSMIHHVDSVAKLEKDVRFARCVGNMMLSGSVWELTEELESAVTSLTECNFTAFYILDNGVLRRARPGLPLASHTAATAATTTESEEEHSPSSANPEEKHGSGTSMTTSSGAKESSTSSAADLIMPPQPPDTLAMADLTLQIKQALQFSAAVDYVMPPPNSSAGESEPLSLLPGVPSIKQAVVLPTSAKLHGYEPGSGVLIIGKTFDDGTPLTAIRDTLEAIAEYFNSALANVSNKLMQEEHTRSLQAQFHLVNNSLGALRDYVVLLNSKGRFMACNKDLEGLLGGPNVGSSSGQRHSSKPSTPHSLVGSEKIVTPAVAILPGSHYTEWLGAGNSPELVRDITTVLNSGKAKHMDKVKFFSSNYPEGILVDYQVVAINNDEIGAGGALSAVAVVPDVAATAAVIKESDGSSLKQVPQLHRTSEHAEGVDDFAVVVVIHTDSFCHQKTLGPAAASPQLKLAALATVPLDTDTAHGVVDAASSIVDNVRAEYSLSSDLEETLKSITQSLNQASRRLSLMNAHPTNYVQYSSMKNALAAPEIALVNNPNAIPSNIFDWEFNVMTISDGLELVNIMGKLFETLLNLEEIGINPGTLARYLIEVGKNYHDRPFHNLQHATCVTHFTYKLIDATKAPENLTQLQLFAIMIAAVVHDVDHPGNTNLFEVNSGSELALRYNDQAVLENHHCSTAFRLMGKPQMAVLATLPKSVAMDVRKMVIGCVMATDMAVHFDLIDETKKKAIDGWNFSELKDQQFLGKILLHAADLSNPVRPFEVSREWARRISMEFNDQVNREKELGMPVLGFMMTPDEKAFCKNETGFASFVVAPMWRALAMVYPTLSFLVEQLDSNVLVWKDSLEKIQQQEEAAAAAATATTASAGADTGGKTSEA